MRITTVVRRETPGAVVGEEAAIGKRAVAGEEEDGAKIEMAGALMEAEGGAKIEIIEAGAEAGDAIGGMIIRNIAMTDRARRCHTTPPILNVAGTKQLSDKPLPT